MLQRQLARIRERPFLEAAMAVGALVAMADEDVRLSEQLGLDHVLDNAKRLEAFDPHEALEIHRRHVEAIRADASAGRIAALATLSSFREDPEAAELLLSVGLVIAKADSEITAVEDRSLGEICHILGLPRAPSFLWERPDDEKE